LKAYPEIFKDYYKMNELKASLLWLSLWIKCVKDVQEQCGHKSYILAKVEHQRGDSRTNAHPPQSSEGK
jgi:hypothetical protein